MKALFLFCLIICTAAERAIIGEETFLTKRKMQKRNPFSKRQGNYLCVYLIAFIFNYILDMWKIIFNVRWEKRWRSWVWVCDSVTGKTFQIRREHLQNKKKREETCITNPFRSIVAAASDPKEKKHAVSYLRSRPCSSRSRLLVAALGVNVKKKKVSNIRRSSLHRNLWTAIKMKAWD